MLPNLSHSSSQDVADHIPVMAHEVAELLELRPGDTVVDCTFGAGGHAAVLEPYLRGSGTYIAVDRDAEAEGYFDQFAAGASAATRFVHGDFALVLRNMAATGQHAHAVLMDLGVSSMQIDRVERGFSYATDAPLDMRMDTSSDTDRCRHPQHLGRAQAGDHLSGVRRGAVLAPDRPRDRSPPPDQGVRSIRRPGRRDQVRDSHAQPVWPRPPRQAGVSGASDRDQRRARVASRGSRRRRRPAPAGRPDGGHQLPLARGSDRQAVHPRRGSRMHLPAGLPDLRVRSQPRAARAHNPRGDAGGGRAHGEPAVGLGQAARRREGQRASERCRSSSRPGLRFRPPVEASPAAPARVRPVRVRRLSTSGLIWMGVLTAAAGRAGGAERGRAALDDRRQ